MPHTGKPLVELPKVEPTSTARHVSDVTSEEKYMTNKSELEETLKHGLNL